jgi:hypothetical protein
LLAHGTGAFYDVQVAPGGSFTMLVIDICNPETGQSLDWWNGSAWGEVVPVVVEVEVAVPRLAPA